MTEKENKDIIEIQTLIKSKGMEDWTIFKKVMDINPEDNEAVINYYKSVAGKYFKKTYSNTLTYCHVHPDIKLVNNYINSLNCVIVEEDMYCLRIFCNNTTFTNDKNHTVCNTNIGRYDKYREISKEQFDEELATCEKIVELAKDTFQKLI